MTEQGFTADQIDTSRAHPGRMYDYFLGGWDNYEVDRAAAEQVIDIHPGVRDSARANRDFLVRAVRAVVNSGVRQIIDVGTGIPTSPNTHEVAQSIAPDTRVVYVDNDPIVATHAGAKLTNAENTGFVLGDVRDPATLLENPALREVVDFRQPVALLLVAVLHFVSDEEDPVGIVSTFADALPAGSPLVLSHATGEPHVGRGYADETARERVLNVYKNSTARLSPRSYAEVERLFGPFTLQDPGVVRVPLWWPDAPRPTDDVLNKVVFCGGMGVKP